MCLRDIEKEGESEMRKRGRGGGRVTERVLVVHKSGKRCEVVLGTRLLTSQNYCRGSITNSLNKYIANHTRKWDTMRRH